MRSVDNDIINKLVAFFLAFDSKSSFYTFDQGVFDTFLKVQNKRWVSDLFRNSLQLAECGKSALQSPLAPPDMPSIVRLHSVLVPQELFLYLS